MHEIITEVIGRVCQRFGASRFRNNERKDISEYCLPGKRYNFLFAQREEARLAARTHDGTEN